MSLLDGLENRIDDLESEPQCSFSQLDAEQCAKRITEVMNLAKKVENASFESEGKIVSKYYYSINTSINVYMYSDLRSDYYGWISEQHRMAYDYSVLGEIILYVSDADHIIPIYKGIMNIMSQNGIIPVKNKILIDRSFYEDLPLSKRLRLKKYSDKEHIYFYRSSVLLPIEGRIYCDKNGRIRTVKKSNE